MNINSTKLNLKKMLRIIRDLKGCQNSGMASDNKPFFKLVGSENFNIKIITPEFRCLALTKPKVFAENMVIAQVPIRSNKIVSVSFPITSYHL